METKKIFAVFAGQGAQFAGMGKDLGQDCWFERANEALGFDIKKICFEGPNEELTKSDICQPAVFVTSVACFEAFKARRADVTFAAFAGLSLGEWSALYAAGTLDFETTVKILRARGRFMQEACEECPGGMVSVMMLPREKVEEISAATGATIANLNSQMQIVLSGTKEQVAAAEAAAKAAGGKATVLNVAGAFHSPLMQPARDKLAAEIAQIDFKPPTIPVFSNVTAMPHAADKIKETMLAQVTSSVLWLDCVKNAAPQVMIEFGPGKTLTGLSKRIDKAIVAMNVQDAASLDAAVAAI